MAVVKEVRSQRYNEILNLGVSRTEVSVGVHESEGGKLYEDGKSILDVAEAAEFGLGQPQRSWLRGFFDEYREEILRIEAIELQKVLEGTQTQDMAAERIGLWIQGSIQRRIRNRIDPPNAKVTIEKKGSDVPLIDHGIFRSAILAYYKGKQIP